MYSYCKKNLIKRKGFTILELVISCVVFGLFLLGVYATLDVGLRSWQLGETKSDLHQKAEVALARIMKDFRYTTLMTLDIDPDTTPVTGFHQYICMETPVNYQTGDIAVDMENCGSPRWYGYVLYYIYPRIGQPNPQNLKRDLYRRYISRNTAGIPMNSLPDSLSDCLLYIDATSGSDIINTVTKDIYSIDFAQEGTSISVTIRLERHIRSNASVAFSPGGDSETGKEVVELKASISPRN